MKELGITYSPVAGAKPAAAVLPLSKSIALRVLVLNAVARRIGLREAHVPELPDAGDVAAMQRALRRQDTAGGVVRIGEGGAPMRFFTALCASMPGCDVTVSAALPLMKRPLLPLLDALRHAGADVESLRRHGVPPLRIRGRSLDPGVIRLDPGVSSQFVSALMLASPLWRHGLHLDFEGRTPVSAPYIAMTAGIMRRFGCRVKWEGPEIDVEGGIINPPERFEIETDWSAASYFYELALLLPGTDIPLERLTPASGSLQGDARCREIFSALGVSATHTDCGGAVLRCDADTLERRRREGVAELDLGSTPDLVPALAVAFCMAGVRFRFTGVAHLRHKESDRMSALVSELAKTGYRLHTGTDSMAWEGERVEAEAVPEISTYRDHRMAMAFAPAAVLFPGLRIENPGVVEKSFPGYWQALEGLGFRLCPR